MQKFLLTVLLTLAMWEVSLAQRNVAGTVNASDGEALPGVSIVVKGTTIGTTTDAAGRYSLVLPQNADVLVFSFIGYVTIEETIGNRSEINVTLADDVTSLEEVVVVGYGTSTKKLSTGAMTNVNGDKLTAVNPVSVDQALQGQMSGVQISSASGSPGGTMNIRVRGITTNGNNNPLVIVDGVIYPIEGLNALNPADIESINVLKDASAAIYGVQAANGVIMVTTKKGKRGAKPMVDFGAYYGMQETPKMLGVLNAREYAILKNETFGSANQAHPFNNVNLGEGTDWQKEVFQRAPIQNYNLSINGGTERGSYSIGGSYLDQEGIVGGDKARYRRYNARLNFTTDFNDRWNLQSVFLYTNEFRKTLPESSIGSVLYNTVNASPARSLKDPVTGEYSYLEEFSDIINPLAQIANSWNETFTNKVVGKEEITYTISDAFEVAARGSYNYGTVDGKSFSPLVYYGSGKPQNSLNDDGTPKTRSITDDLSLPLNGSVNEQRASYLDYGFEGFITFNKTFNEHAVVAVLGTSFFGRRSNIVGGSGYGVPYNSWDYADLSLAQDQLLATSYSSQNRERIQSVFGRAEYKYEGKYILTGILRRDGSSKFGANNRYGIFPSALLAWLASEEDFFNLSGVNMLKLRGSYGVIGNDKIGPWGYRAQLDGEAVYNFDGQSIIGRTIGRLGNPDLKWETTHQTNIGIDIGLLEDRLSVNADYYVKQTKDLLFQPDVPAIMGGYGAGEAPPIINGGDVRNRGVEVMLTYRDKIGENLNFNISYNFTTLDNEVTALPDGKDFFPGGAFGVGGVSPSRMQVGYPIGYFFGYKTDGIYQTEAEIAERGVTQSLAKPGDLRFVDVNNDGEINFSDNSDRTMIGSPIPELTMGLNVGVNFKGIDFSATIYSALGGEILRNYERQQPLANILVHNIERWTGPDSSNEIPRLTNESNRNAVISDYFVEDGSFARVKNIQLGYSLPSSVLQHLKLTRLRIYVAANNLYTFTKYKGFDPDFSSYNPNGSGIDYGFYPQARTYMAGLNLNF